MSDIIPSLGVEEAKDWKKLLKALAAEFIGTMFLVILACGACINVSKLRNALDYICNAISSRTFL